MIWKEGLRYNYSRQHRSSNIYIDGIGERIIDMRLCLNNIRKHLMLGRINSDKYVDVYRG